MTNYELIETLKKASESIGQNIALSLLLIVASERIKELSDYIETLERN